ncbi:hypothetical protein JCM6292_1699 [Bacteroides pyogenes JCM 6292]|uniref:Uncharacterized protein n=3 Tax=Bacteroides pyogenes TaxID=310300 RepID=W4PH81_9BACE|nr:hypothetical protein [Bacteroides pyogenes]GAE15425.1 hypothetical protein JCM6292_1699 [Bacteroides pyogenes JCM 6292]GAE19040.1 hypothetical protein JCM6294_2042 [Bacteroides pyogenes DSM 20611 = JCM 6294]
MQLSVSISRLKREKEKGKISIHKPGSAATGYTVKLESGEKKKQVGSKIMKPKKRFYSNRSYSQPKKKKQKSQSAHQNFEKTDCSANLKQKNREVFIINHTA